MKKTISAIVFTAILLTACGKSQIHFADPVDVDKALDESAAQAVAYAEATNHADLTPVLAKGRSLFIVASPAEKDEDALTEPDDAQPAEDAETEPESQPEQTAEPEIESTPEAASVPAPTPEPTATPAPAAAPAYGAIPFELAASTGTWWGIDSSDSAYWAMQEQINAVRAAGGLPALAMDSGLSAIADARCESFVAGGPFDHSGMVTKTEILAAGPLGSASAACAAWVASETHYANIMRTDISSMGVACWFCDVGGNRYTFWTVTFS